MIDWRDPLTQDIVLVLVGALSGLSLLWLFLALVAQRRRLTQRCAVEITNTGNVPSRYELRVVNDGDRLWCEWLLPQSMPAAPATMSPPRSVPAGAAQPTQSVHASQPAQPAAGAQAGGLARLVSEALIGLGYLLPRGWGSGLLGAGTRLARAQHTVEQAQHTVNRLDAAKPAARIRAEAARPPAQPAAGPAVTWTTVPADGWVATPALPPGESLSVALLVQPRRWPEPQAYALQVLSRSADSREAPQLARQASLRFPRFLGWAIYLPGLLWLALTGWFLVLAWVWWWGPVLLG